MISFDIVKKGEGHMRTGVLTTPHGLVETPSYVIVGTHAEVRCLTPEDIKATGTQMVISNTYHLWRELGDEGLNSYQGVHQDMGWDGPIMTDSGGFQVFSLGAAREHGVGKVEDGTEGRKDENLVSVTDAGVSFDDGEPAYLDAELSIKIQEQLGADIMFAFDEPSSPRHDRAYTEQAMARTHAWATRSLDARTSDQALYGIVQGGAYEDLRKASATYIGKLPFDGFGIGGSFGSSFGSAKENTANELLWTVPHLPERKPRHLLGMGRVEDLFIGVEAGIDTFDCVIPTREARHGGIWTRNGRIDVKRSKGAVSLDEGCECPACSEGVTREGLRDLFKEKNQDAGRFATLHNVYFFNDLMRKIRNTIREGGDLGVLRKEYGV